MALKQTITIQGSPERIYRTLTTASEFGKVTGSPAVMSAVEGGAFSCFGGQITGRNIELVPNRRIVQAWRAGAWPEGVYSVVRFDIRRSGSASIVDLEQSGFPDGTAEHLEGGWHKMYWEPLRAFLD